MYKKYGRDLPEYIEELMPEIRIQVVQMFLHDSRFPGVGQGDPRKPEFHFNSAIPLTWGDWFEPKYIAEVLVRSPEFGTASEPTSAQDEPNDDEPDDDEFEYGETMTGASVAAVNLLCPCGRIPWSRFTSEDSVRDYVRLFNDGHINMTDQRENDRMPWSSRNNSQQHDYDVMMWLIEDGYIELRPDDWAYDPTNWQTLRTSNQGVYNNSLHFLRIQMPFYFGIPVDYDDTPDDTPLPPETTPVLEHFDSWNPYTWDWAEDQTLPWAVWIGDGIQLANQISWPMYPSRSSEHYMFRQNNAERLKRVQLELRLMFPEWGGFYVYPEFSETFDRINPRTWYDMNTVVNPMRDFPDYVSESGYTDFERRVIDAVNRLLRQEWHEAQPVYVQFTRPPTAGGSGGGTDASPFDRIDIPTAIVMSAITPDSIMETNPRNPMSTMQRHQAYERLMSDLRTGRQSWMHSSFVQRVNVFRMYFLPALISAWFSLFMIIMILMIFIRRIFEMVMLFIIAPLFVAPMPLDDGAKFKAWKDAFIGKAISGFSSIIMLRLYLLFMPLIWNSGIRFAPDPGSDTMLKLLFMAGGIYAVYKSHTMITGMVSQSQGQADKESSTGLVGSFTVGAVSSGIQQATSGMVSKVAGKPFAILDKKLDKKFMPGKDSGGGKSSTASKPEKSGKSEQKSEQKFDKKNDSNNKFNMPGKETKPEPSTSKPDLSNYSESPPPVNPMPKLTPPPPLPFREEIEEFKKKRSEEKEKEKTKD